MRLFLPVALLLFTLGISYYGYTYLTTHRFTNMSALLLLSSLLILLIGLISEQVSALHYKGIDDARRVRREGPWVVAVAVRGIPAGDRRGRSVARQARIHSPGSPGSPLRPECPGWARPRREPCLPYRRMPRLRQTPDVACSCLGRRCRSRVVSEDPSDP